MAVNTWQQRLLLTPNDLTLTLARVALALVFLGHDRAAHEHRKHRHTVIERSRELDAKEVIGPIEAGRS